MKPAVFIDKDGTLVHDVPYNVDPAKAVLRSDCGAALRRLRRGGYLLIVVSNQPGVAFGHFHETKLEAIWEWLDRSLAPHRAAPDGIYYCPHHPAGVDPAYTTACACRKPSPGMLLQAAADFDIDLRRSWMIGDILDDVETGRRAGCRTILLDIGSETEWRDGALRRPHRIATSLMRAADHVLGRAGRQPEASSWMA